MINLPTDEQISLFYQNPQSNVTLTNNYVQPFRDKASDYQDVSQRIKRMEEFERNRGEWAKEGRNEQKLQMSQKFIYTPEKTAKKATLYHQQRPKRFNRRPSERDRSFDSKRSKEDSINSHYIKPPSPGHIISIVSQDDPFMFLDELSTSNIKPMESERQPRRSTLTRTNAGVNPTREQCTLTLRIKILETQMKSKQGQCERLKLQAEEQRDRRRKAEFDRKGLHKEGAILQRRNEELVTELKKLSKEKEYLNKQIQFLQKINYDEKTRNIQSFREKHMQDQLFRLRERLKGQQSSLEGQYETQIHFLSCQKEAAQQKFRSMESLVNVLKRTIAHLKMQIVEERILTKERIVHSEEYRDLRDRFKRFIDQYKEMKNQHSTMKKMVQVRETEQTELVLSEEQSERV